MPDPGKGTRLILAAEDRALWAVTRRWRKREKRRRIRAAILLEAAGGLTEQAKAAAQKVNRTTVVLCIQKYLRFGLDAALGDLPRPGKPRRVTDEAIAWMQNLACQKPKDLGYAQELWTYKLLGEHIRRAAPAAGYAELARLSRSKLHKILTRRELKPHKVRYYVERRDPEFEQKMTAVMHEYKEEEDINPGLMKSTLREPRPGTVSYG